MSRVTDPLDFTLKSGSFLFVMQNLEDVIRLGQLILSLVEHGFGSSAFGSPVIVQSLGGALLDFVLGLEGCVLLWLTYPFDQNLNATIRQLTMLQQLLNLHFGVLSGIGSVILVSRVFSHSLGVVVDGPPQCSRIRRGTRITVTLE
jgi:hypothetical protein